MNFSDVNLGQQDVPAFPRLTVNNTGNDDFDRINITGSDLVGTTTSGESIAITNFQANTTNKTSSDSGKGEPLALTAITLRELVQSGTDTLDNTTLLHGHTSAQTDYNDLVISGKGNQSVYIWIDVPTGGLSSQLYNATWNITVINVP